MKFTIKAFDAIQLKVVGSVWLAGALLSYGAIHAMTSAVRAKTEIVAQGGKPLPKIERASTPLEKAATTALIQQLTILHPAVSIQEMSNGHINILIKSPTDYNEWRAAVADLMQAGGTDTMVETISICGANCSGSYCAAEFAVKKIRYVVS